MSKFLLTWLICAVVFLVIDLAWIGAAAKSFTGTRLVICWRMNSVR